MESILLRGEKGARKRKMGHSRVGWLLVEAPHTGRDRDVRSGGGNTVSGLSTGKSGNDLAWHHFYHLLLFRREGPCVYVLERPLARSPGTNLGADTQGPGAKGQTAPGVGPDPLLLLLLLIVSISNLMMHTYITFFLF